MGITVRNGSGTYPTMVGWDNSGSPFHYNFNTGRQLTPITKSMTLPAATTDVATGDLIPSSSAVAFSPKIKFIETADPNQFTWDGPNPPLDWSNSAFIRGPEAFCSKNDLTTDPAKIYLCSIDVRYRYQISIRVNEDRGAILASVVDSCGIGNTTTDETDRNNLMVNGGRPF